VIEMSEKLAAAQAQAEEAGITPDQLAVIIQAVLAMIEIFRNWRKT
jgi:hypothetical protein